MLPTDGIWDALSNAACSLKGRARRVFMAAVVRDLGRGGQRQAQAQLGWSRMTIRRQNAARFDGIDTLVLNLDNGPDNNSRRTQFIHRVVDFVDAHQITVRLAYYPPYDSKYNPVERVWSVLENEWNGELLDSIPAALGHAQSMTWNGIAVDRRSRPAEALRDGGSARARARARTQMPSAKRPRSQQPVG